ncbi:MAG: nucleoside diphosphate kinase regulator [Kaistia sp. SCN 65-12]|nr:MAG: nucleoside diphosphate kinase regulator [Kaistia sp. SCN 65-12]
MEATTKSRDQLAIHVDTTDHGRLTGLAQSALDRVPDIAEDLLAEMDRATITDPLPENVVRMGSTVTFRSGAEAAKRITLVYPGEADIAQNKISILTPLGTALIGLSSGQKVVWSARDGKERVLEIASVEPPAGGLPS